MADTQGYYHRAHGMSIVMLRPWDFTPYGNDFLRYGTRLLAGGVDRRDVIDATVRAIDYAFEGEAKCDWFEIGKDHPFTPEDCEEFKTAPQNVIERYWPGYGELIQKYGLQFPKEPTLCSLAKTKEVLGFNPKYDFGTFLEELARRDRKENGHRNPV